MALTSTIEKSTKGFFNPLAVLETTETMMDLVHFVDCPFGIPMLNTFKRFALVICLSRG